MAIVVNHRLGQFRFPDNYTEEQINQKIVEAEAEYGEQYSIGETLYRNAERGFTSSFRGIRNFVTGEEPDEEDLETEYESRVMLEQNPIAGYTGLIAGSLADPVTIPAAFLKPIKIGGTILTGAARYTPVGLAAGAIEPTYEEFGDSQVANIVAGGTIGGVLGAAVGKFLPDVIEPQVRLDAKGYVFPEDVPKVNRNGSLQDEVYSALKDVELAKVEADIGKTLKKTDRIETIQQYAGRLYDEFGQPLADMPVPPTRQFDPVARLREEFQAKIQPVGEKLKTTPNKELANLNRQLQTVTQQKAIAQKELQGRGTALSKVKPQKAYDTAVAAESKIKAKIAEINEAKRYSTHLKNLDKGQISKLTKADQEKLKQYTKEAGFALKQFNKVAQPVPEQTQAPLPKDVEELIEQLNAKAKQVKTPTTNQLPSSQPTIEPIAREQLGLDPRTSAGSMGTRPSARYEAITKEGIVDDAAIEAVRKTGTQGKSKVEIPGASPAENKFYSRLRDMTAPQMVKLKQQEYGYYSWDNVSAEGVAVRDRILNDYNDMTEWFIEKANRNEVLVPQELEAIFPLIQEAEQRILDNRAIISSLIRAGDARSEDAVRLNDEILLYNYLTQAFDAQGTIASNIMTQMKRWKRLHGKHEAQLRAGKEVKDVLGVVC